MPEPYWYIYQESKTDSHQSGVNFLCIHEVSAIAKNERTIHPQERTMKKGVNKLKTFNPTKKSMITWELGYGRPPSV